VTIITNVSFVLLVYAVILITECIETFQLDRMLRFDIL